MTVTATYTSVTPERFAGEIRPLGRPAILKGAVADWPAVSHGRQSDDALIDYIAGHDTGQIAGVYVGTPEIAGHFFYGADTRSDNFRYGPAPIPQALDRLRQERNQDRPHSVYVQSAEISKHMPGFGAENRLDLLPDVAPRIWIGNQAVTRAHYDLNYNIACVVAGRRRFLLFPPDQVANLYPGPFDRTIGGVPVSMVDASNPDLDRYPLFAEAQKTMLTADLEPGDALYIPYGWWHQVHSLSAFNVLVNYWWDDAASAASPYDALFHAILAVRDLPADHHDLWRPLFDYYVFDQAALAHLSDRDRGTLGPMTPDLARRIKQSLARSLDAGKP
ncbi:hypothetical protein AEAC466_09935 [Asticcacaulis sp. AC466]|uniref:cupin-like domain-containing protein n=1 Tax=Asticcacaulis sp. AC466 TaxID=1282362 RepID=UPI0003C3B605|nr:cupin-like domain-containing protein [Asticcacaulis sp. AC466]ESQ84055.1 hypothetical protein AEAC466_09935 [Asticcacaulis sp. AC466]